jgi:hypothetical protein
MAAREEAGPLGGVRGLLAKAAGRRAAVTGADAAKGEPLAYLLEARDEEEFQRRLEGVIGEHAGPVIERVIRKRLRVSLHDAGRGPERQEQLEAGEVYREAVARLIGLHSHGAGSLARVADCAIRGNRITGLLASHKGTIQWSRDCVMEDNGPDGRRHEARESGGVIERVAGFREE